MEVWRRSDLVLCGSPGWSESSLLPSLPYLSSSSVSPRASLLSCFFLAAFCHSSSPRVCVRVLAPSVSVSQGSQKGGGSGRRTPFLRSGCCLTVRGAGRQAEQPSSPTAISRAISPWKNSPKEIPKSDPASVLSFFYIYFVFFLVYDNLVFLYDCRYEFMMFSFSPFLVYNNFVFYFFI